MALLTLCGDQDQFTKVKTSATSETWVHIRNLNCGIDADDQTITIRDRNDDLVVVNAQNVLSLNGTTIAQCITDVNDFFDALLQP